MKSSTKKILICTLVLIGFTVLPGYCAPTTIKQAAIKFLLAMGGVALSSLIIYVGLSVYNKMFVHTKSDFDSVEKLDTPKNTDDAIDFFIIKNKLR